MNRSQLITNLANQFRNLTSEDAEVSVTLILDAIKNAMANGGRVEIRGFGSFSLNHKNPRMGRNPKTGERIMVPAKSVFFFKPGIEMKKRVDACLQPPLAATDNPWSNQYQIPARNPAQL
ncbi:integration host factor subunit beta [Sulfuricella sp. T08]|uniref:integration host factor subunit beta n=1 Tax=Sulfuricella sp. T08 TaxID=1632857 RepID=UPI0006179F40|nr:integration host factor subunit beta [Sulfuricella sp. T08]GAO36010.1 integration host factor subunit beta [Sulfuricella sp. T08]